VLKVTGDGAFQYLNPGGVPCTVTVSLRGFLTIRATLPAGALILHRLGYEGGASMASVSAGALECPAQAGEAYGKGEAAFGLGDRAAAEKWLRRVTSVCPGHSLAWDELGVILQVSNRIEEARAAYETAVAKDPRSARALTHLAGLAIQESRHAAALELCERAIRLKPMDLPRLWLYYGLEGYRTGQFKAAEERLSRAIEEDRRHLFPLAEFLLGMTMAREGEMAGASTHLRAYLALEPGSVEADQARQMLANTQAPGQ
jgi:Flp pilus assembly protein TadD